MGYDPSVQAKAIDLIKLCVEMTTAADSGHVTTGASLAHLVTVLLYDHMRYDPRDPAGGAADRLVLSEGHACPIVYAAAADLGFAIGIDPAQRRPMTREDALQLRAIDSPIDGHPNPAEGFPFFPAATGSLGQGLSVSAGLALAARMDGVNKRIYCIIGDGESREGQIWEAADFIIDYRLLEVCAIFNCNTYGQPTSCWRDFPASWLSGSSPAVARALTLSWTARGRKARRVTSDKCRSPSWAAPPTASTWRCSPSRWSRARKKRCAAAR